MNSLAHAGPKSDIIIQAFNRSIPQDIYEEASKYMGDYLEMFLLTMFFFVGAPTNLIICRKLWARRKSRLAWFQLLQHLNFSDLLILWVYSPCRIARKLFQHWYGGIFLCKLIIFLEALPFYISSNIIVCIALDKVLSYRGGWHSSRQKRVRTLLTIGWLIALATVTFQFLRSIEKISGKLHNFKKFRENYTI